MPRTIPPFLMFDGAAEDAMKIYVAQFGWLNDRFGVSWQLNLD